jgi:acetoin utilization protein AcuB
MAGSRARVEREPTMRDVMAPWIAPVAPSTPVGDAHRLLREHKISHLPVLDDDLLIGIVSRRDLMRADSDALPVSSVMATMVYVLSPDTPMSRAAQIFRERRVPVLPVLDGRTLVGFVRAVDVLETAWDRAKS